MHAMCVHAHGALDSHHPAHVHRPPRLMFSLPSHASCVFDRSRYPHANAHMQHRPLFHYPTNRKKKLAEEGVESI